MGQKTHPIGLRVGLWQRRWNNTWYTTQNEYSKLFFAHHRVDMMLKNFFYSYSMTKKMFANRALLVNSRFIKSNINLGFLFIFFYKLRAKKIRRLKKKKTKKFVLNTFKRKKYFTVASKFTRNKKVQNLNPTKEVQDLNTNKKIQDLNTNKKILPNLNPNKNLNLNYNLNKEKKQRPQKGIYNKKVEDLNPNKKRHNLHNLNTTKKVEDLNPNRNLNQNLNSNKKINKFNFNKNFNDNKKN